MKKRNKLGLAAIFLGAVALFATSCTANFATDKEKGRIAYALEPGVSKFVIKDSEEEKAIADEYKISIDDDSLNIGNIVQIIEYTKGDNGEVLSYTNSNQLNSIIDSAKNSSIAVPSKNYFAEFDRRAFLKIVDAFNADEKNGTKLDLDNPEANLLKLCLEDYGYVKFCNSRNFLTQSNNRTVVDIVSSNVS